MNKILFSLFLYCIETNAEIPISSKLPIKPILPILPKFPSPPIPMPMKPMPMQPITPMWPQYLTDSCEEQIPNYCNDLTESNYFDPECFTYNDKYNNLGCNAGGLKCCRYCGFGPYINITCILSPNLPPRPPLPPKYPLPLMPPLPPKPCGIIIPNYCDSLIEKNYFDQNCYSYNDYYGNLGCNAGGLRCCRFCEFGYYENISCILSPSSPPIPPTQPIPPNNPLVVPIKNIYIPPKKSIIRFNIRIDSVIETFNINMFKKRLQKTLHRSILLKNIRLRVRAGSLIVDIIILTDDKIAKNTVKTIENMTPTALSNVLNVTVAEFSNPIIENHHFLR